MPKDKSRTVTFTDQKKKLNQDNESAPRTLQLGDARLPRPVLYHEHLKPTARIVAEWLYDHCKPGTLVATGSHEKIAQDLHLSKPTIIKGITELRKYRIIMTVQQHINKRGVVFNSYALRDYGPADAKAVSKAIKLVKPHNPAQGLKKRLKKGEIPIYENAPVKCTTCNDTKWVTVPGTRSVDRCPDCKKRTGKI